MLYNVDYLKGRLDGLQEALDHAMDRLGMLQAMRDPYVQALRERRDIAHTELRAALAAGQVA